MFDFDRISVGDTVLYMNDIGEPQAHMMIVLKVGDDSIDGLVFWGINLGTCAVKTGVMHVTDERLKDEKFRQSVFNSDDDEGGNESGVFIESPTVAELRTQIDNLTERLESLEGRPRAAAGNEEEGDESAPSESHASESSKPPAKKARGMTNERGETVKLSDMLGAASPVKVDPVAKAAALAAAAT